LILLEDARTRGQYLSYGLSREGAEICLNTAREVIVFGSVIKGRATGASDLDLAVVVRG